ncbi:MAG: hypothetical protein NC907_05960 [Candidatus Omnitrophica bacterium]|nr:hypothetical protein [Candidatus Omnitrophota bacterium]
MENEEKYMVAKHLIQVFEKQNRLLAFNARNKKQFLQWKQKTRRKLKELVGYYRFTICKPNPAINEICETEDFIRIHMEINTEPGVRMPFYIQRLLRCMATVVAVSILSQEDQIFLK